MALSEIDELLDDSLAFDVRLLVSELVTNSVRHAEVGPDDSIQLRVAVGQGSVRVEVVDSGPGFDPPNDTTDPTETRERGWGLFFVTQLADRWGIERDCGGVWFEIDRGDENAEAGQDAA